MQHCTVFKLITINITRTTCGRPSLGLRFLSIYRCCRKCVSLRYLMVHSVPHGLCMLWSALITCTFCEWTIVFTGSIALVSLFKCQCTLVCALKELTSSNSSKPSSLKNRPACQQRTLKELTSSVSHLSKLLEQTSSKLGQRAIFTQESDSVPTTSQRTNWPASHSKKEKQTNSKLGQRAIFTQKPVLELKY